MSFETNDVENTALSRLRKLLSSGLLAIAKQPRNNALDLSDQSIRRIYIFLIDHDYPGGSAAMHNAVFEAYGLPYRSCFMIGDPARVKDIFAELRASAVYFGGGAGSGFKDKIGSSLDKLDGSAATIGSVNVIAREHGSFVGYNTDGAGFTAGLLDEYPNSVGWRHGASHRLRVGQARTQRGGYRQPHRGKGRSYRAPNFTPRVSPGGGRGGHRR
ncbi:MAG: hypothetical protein HY765_01495 [Rhodomicrobium sp.]|nr:hypothetical protein [Rhodomicrobium sp.]